MTKRHTKELKTTQFGLQPHLDYNHTLRIKANY